MSTGPGWAAPGEPPPGWSPEQPPPHPGTAPAAPPPPAWAPPARPAPGWGSTPGWAPPPAPKPGVVPLRPLGVGEVLDGAISTVREHPRVTLLISGAVAVFSGLVTFLVTLWLSAALDDTARRLDDQEALTDEQAFDALGSLVAVTGLASAAQALVTGLAVTVATGLLTVVVSRAVLGQSLDLASTWRIGAPRLLPLVGVSVLYLLLWTSGFLVAGLLGAALALVSVPLGVVVGVLLGLAAVPLAVWCYVLFALAAPVVVLERKGVVASLRRSAELVRGAFWRTFGLLLLVVLLVVVVGNIVQVPFALAGQGGSFLDPDATFDEVFSTTAAVLNALGVLVSLLLTVPFAAAATVLVYVDRRIRREGLDHELARAAQVRPPT